MSLHLTIPKMFMRLGAWLTMSSCPEWCEQFLFSLGVFILNTNILYDCGGGWHRARVRLARKKFGLYYGWAILHTSTCQVLSTNIDCLFCPFTSSSAAARETGKRFGSTNFYCQDKQEISAPLLIPSSSPEIHRSPSCPTHPANINMLRVVWW